MIAVLQRTRPPINATNNKGNKKMMEKKEIFADGIGQIHFAGGMVRFDFVTLDRKSVV